VQSPPAFYTTDAFKTANAPRRVSTSACAHITGGDMIRAMFGKHTSEWWTAFFTAIIAVTGAVALIYASRQLQDAHEEAQIQHLLALDQQYRQEPMISYRRSYAINRRAGHDYGPDETRLLDFFETIGLLTDRGYLRDKDVWETFGYAILCLNAVNQDWIAQDQKEKDPSEYSKFTWLVTRLESIEKETNGAVWNPSPQQLQEFWADEAKVIVDTPTSKSKTKRIQKP
jgi:hypothetical protein